MTGRRASRREVLGGRLQTYHLREAQMRIRDFALFFLLFSSALIGQIENTTIHVTADGYSYLGEDVTLKQARSRVMQDVERNAVEKGTGVYVESFSTINKNVLLDDEILSIAGGYLSGKTVLLDRLEVEPPRYHVQIGADVKCADLEKLIEGRKAEKKVQNTGVAVDFVVVAERLLADGTWGEVNVWDGGELKSFDKFQIYLEPHSDCHAYLLIYDSAGKASLLFPSKETGGSALLKNGFETRIPGRDLYFELDDKAGIETLYLLASPGPLADIEWLIEKMDKAGADSAIGAALTRSIATRGIGRIVPGARVSFALTGGGKAEKVTELVTGKGTFFRKLGFKHVP
jgi:hypothetical protein